MNPLRKRTPHYGQSNTGYGSTSAGSGWNQAGCSTATPTNVVGNAGTPGCGTSTLPGTECQLKLVFKNSGEVAAGAESSIEVLAGRAGAFKPRAVYMVGIGSADPSVNVRFQILDVNVMGDPQLVNYQGSSIAIERGLTDFFNMQCMPQGVDWTVFGSSAGQGLQITVRNLEPATAAVFYIAIWGDAASCDLVGRA